MWNKPTVFVREYERFRLGRWELVRAHTRSWPRSSRALAGESRQGRPGRQPWASHLLYTLSVCHLPYMIRLDDV
jgi:hypothetical protein